MPRTTSAARTAPRPSEAAAARPRRTVPLGDVEIAPENLRAGEAADAEVPLLADALFAAGQLQALTVRPGRRRETPWMALDGRRRLLALRLLADQGRIEASHPVEVIVETDPVRQAAAVVLTNTAAPVHVADVIAAIGRMLKSRLGVPVIARALGYGETEVKRLAALSALPETALQALRAGRMTLRQARLLARLKDPEAQAEFAQAALDGQGFPDWRVNERLDAGQVDASDPRCGLVTPQAYAAAGGAIETDLFDERPPVLRDPARLTDLWTARAQAIAAPFEAEGLTVHVAPGEPPELPDDLETAGYVYRGRLGAEEMADYRRAQASRDAAAEAVAALLEEGADPEAVDDALAGLIQAGLAMDQIALGGRVATVLVFHPSRREGLRVRAYAPVEPEAAAEVEAGETDGAPEPAAPRFEPPRVEAPAPDVEGVGHALHRVRTEVATRGLIRALADDPRTAMTALIARLFGLIVGGAARPRSQAALSMTATRFDPRAGRVIEALDGVVRQRLDARQAAWEASGLTLLRWIHGLEAADRLGLLGELTSLTLDLVEDRTSLIRREARADAVELAELSGAELSRHWTPDAVFLKAHSKAQLLEMLAAMGKAAPQAGALPKADLVTLVEATAAARGWIPTALSWAAPTAGDKGDEAESAPEAGSETEPGSESTTGPDLEEGRGGLVVTPEGEAALEDAAA